MSSTQKTGKAAAADDKYEGFTEDERAAMKDRARELKAAGRRGKAAKADEEGEVLAKIAEMPEADRLKAERLHALIKASMPDLTSKTWYGMPAYYKDGNVLCFFQSAHKFKSRYAMLGFSDKAHLDDGDMWPTYYALAELTEAVESRIVELLHKATS
jgi:uncharacterized protein YdhG (YjbR/CyaY superfamily)